MTTDAALVTRSQAGDDDAFRALYERHRPSVERVCRKWLRDPYLVEDAVQTTFLKAWTALPAFSGGAEIDRWLRRIASNHCHDLWRNHVRAGEMTWVEDLATERADTVGSRSTSEVIDRLAVEKVLGNLGRRDASILVQRHIGDSSVGALAAQWGLTKGAMDVALHRARLRARRLAVAEGLRGLLPIGLIRRASAMLQRVGSIAADGGAVLTGVGNIVIAVALVAPAVGPAAYADEQVVTRSATQMVSDADHSALSLPASDASARGDRLADPANEPVPVHSDETTQGVTAAPVGSGSNPGTVNSPDRSAVVEFEPIRAPGNGPTVSATPKYRHPDRSVGARLAPGIEPGVDENQDDAPEQIAKPAFDAACTVAKAGDPVTYCKD